MAGGPGIDSETWDSSNPNSSLSTHQRYWVPQDRGPRGQVLVRGVEISLLRPGLARTPTRLSQPTTDTGCPGLDSETWDTDHIHRQLFRYTLTPMARGLVRYQQCGCLHFVTFSCFHRLPHLGTGVGRDLFESTLERIRLRYRFVVSGYVVVPEHIHMLVSEPHNGLLARSIQALKLSVAKRRAVSPFWQLRYYDFNVWSADKVTEKLRYMHRNPVARGLVAKPEDWLWSSFRHYATGEIGIVEIESQGTAFRRGNQLPEHLRYTERTLEIRALPPFAR